VSIIEPGMVATTMWDQELDAQDAWLRALPPEGRMHYGAGVRRRREKLSVRKSTALDPMVVARVVADALLDARPKPRYVVGRKARLLVALDRALPERTLIRLTS
jgi:hypothetical protein